jgi:hypothetical protein
VKRLSDVRAALSGVMVTHITVMDRLLQCEEAASRGVIHFTIREFVAGQLVPVVRACKAVACGYEFSKGAWSLVALLAIYDAQARTIRDS